MEFHAFYSEKHARKGATIAVWEREDGTPVEVTGVTSDPGQYKWPKRDLGKVKKFVRTIRYGVSL